MGVALPWAMATCLVRPGTQVVSVSGDGGFLMSAMELETARRLGMQAPTRFLLVGYLAGVLIYPAAGSSSR
jgi:thiamine pyrophosphate-dependent acetolactate synthase large subunit-like protein